MIGVWTCTAKHEEYYSDSFREGITYLGMRRLEIQALFRHPNGQLRIPNRPGGFINLVKHKLNSKQLPGVTLMLSESSPMIGEDLKRCGLSCPPIGAEAVITFPGITHRLRYSADRDRGVFLFMYADVTLGGDNGKG